MIAAFKIKDIGFGEANYGTTDIENLIPKTLPYKFSKNPEPWTSVATQWFNYGIGKDSKLVPTFGIDKEKAMKHIQCLFNTWSLKKDDKIKNAAFLLSQWFTEIKL